MMTFCWDYSFTLGVGGLNLWTDVGLLWVAGRTLTPLACASTTRANQSARTPDALLEIKSLFSSTALGASIAGTLWLLLCALANPLWRRSSGMRLLILHFAGQFLFALVFFLVVSLSGGAGCPARMPGSDPRSLDAFAQQYAFFRLLAFF